MQTTDSVIAVLCGDLHFSHTPPLARSKEDWYEVQKGYLLQLNRLTDQRIQSESGVFKFQKVPILCSGDVLDHWKAPPELVNFLMEHMPVIYSIPGQHDIPYHNYKEIKKSAYWTLVQAGKIINLSPDPTPVGELLVHGFPWRFPISPYEGERLDPLIKTVCVAHSYIWTEETGHPHAAQEKRLRSYRKALEGYDICLFGDNHQTIHVVKDTTTIFNPGTFMRRHGQEFKHQPCVGLLLESGRIKKHYLDISKDKMLTRQSSKKALREDPRFQVLALELKELGHSSIDFLRILTSFLEKSECSEGVRDCILELVEESRGS